MPRHIYALKKSILLTLMAMMLFIPAGCGGKRGDDEPAADDSAVEAGPASDATVSQAPAATGESAPPAGPVRLIFIHHSVGEAWLSDSEGGLGLALMENNYYISDTNYGWGPDSIGDTTDIGDWYTWFAGDGSATYTEALYAESEQGSDYSRDESLDPGGENEIVMFKSCFPNSGLNGSAGDSATTGDNPLRGEGSGSEAHTVANAKGIYNDTLDYFATRQDKLFVVVTAPPLIDSATDAGQAANARAFNRWLVEEWLADYPYNNVAVFDLYNVLTSNGGDPDTSDAGSSSGNHHRFRDGAVEYITGQGGDFAAYGAWEDSHPTAAGSRKATEEFIEILNIAFNRWQGN